MVPVHFSTRGKLNLGISWQSRDSLRGIILLTVRKDQNVIQEFTNNSYETTNCCQNHCVLFSIVLSAEISNVGSKDYLGCTVAGFHEVRDPLVGIRHKSRNFLYFHSISDEVCYISQYHSIIVVLHNVCFFPMQ